MDFIRQHGTVQVDPLAKAFRVTPQTIRRDLNFLYKRELLQRVHGGAVIKDSVENLGYRARKEIMMKEKDAIARRAAAIIPNNSSLILNLGTTTEKVAEHLLEHSGLLVITNNINVAALLWPSTSFEVMVASGTIRHEDGGIVGSSTEDFINKFKVDYAVIGCSAIDEDGEILDYDLREVRVAQTIMRRARRVILVTDSMKFNRTAPIKLGELKQVDYLVTDEGVPDEMKQICKKTNTNLEIINSSNENKTGRTA